MSLDYTTLELLRRNHPAWRFLCSDNAPLVASFLHRVYIQPNERVLSQAELVEALEDELFVLRERGGEDSFPRASLDYLNDWAGNDRAWLRKFYPAGSDEPHFDLTPATEKALSWLVGLSERSFVGTESRLLTLFGLLRQMHEGTETDPEARVEKLQQRRREIDEEIGRIRAGDLPLLDETGLRDRFQQFIQLARELLMDFREVEENFRRLDRQVRERIALWEGAKGSLLEGIMGERDAIADSDQGRSFRAFWDFLMSRDRQEELTLLLEKVLALEPIAEMAPDPRLRRIHYDWLAAGEQAQRTVALLSRQLRRFLDDQAWLENRRIMDILHTIETGALAVREQPPTGEFLSISGTAVEFELPMERPLFTPPLSVKIDDSVLETGAVEMDTDTLFSQVIVDQRVLAERIRKVLQEQKQVSLATLLQEYPLEQGLAELVAYMQLATGMEYSVVDDENREQVVWQGADGVWRQAQLPRIVFARG